MDCSDIAVVVLAAGLSRRFGGDKLASCLDGQSLGVHIAQTVRQLSFGWHFAVCGKASTIASEYATEGFAVIENDKPESGQAHSLHLGVAAAQGSDAKALLITLADMPFVTAKHLAAIARHGGFAASTDGAVVMPPALFPRELWPVLLNTEGDAGARLLLREAHKVAAPPSELRDIDVTDDLIRPAGL